MPTNKSNKISKSSVSVVAGPLVIALVLGGFVYNSIQIRNLKSQVESLQTDDTYEEGKQVSYKLISQEVKELKYLDIEAQPMMAADGSYENQYKAGKVRILEVEVTNNTDSLYSYYDGSLGVVGEDGVIARSVTIDPEQNQNVSSLGLELAPGGTTTLYVYILDTGTEVTDLYNMDTSSKIEL